MEQNDFKWLQDWYQSHCNGDWEHGSGIHLGTIDNPGWSLTVNIEDTELENKVFHQIEINRSEKDWIFCRIRDAQFEARCGLYNLSEILKVFRNWAQSK
jgi:hypothetical protein